MNCGNTNEMSMWPMVFHSLHGLMNSINWPASSIWVFIAQLGEHCSANAEATGSNPVEAPKNFFSGYFRNCLNCDSLRWSHTHFNPIEISNTFSRPFPHSNEQWRQVEVRSGWKCPPQPRSSSFVRKHRSEMSERSIKQSYIKYSIKGPKWTN